MPRKTGLGLCLSCAAVGAVLWCAGCASHRPPSDVHQFPPLPQARVGAADLPPIAPRSVPDLLRDAEKAFNAANKAQEQGDSESALRHYTLMLELLTDAEMNPAVFYSLRSEFANILDASAKQARLYGRHEPRPLEEGEFEPTPGYSDLEVPFPVPERVLLEIEEIQKGYPRNFQAGLDRSFRYIPYVRAELEKAGLPQELLWMAMIESQFTPKIVSRAGAGGMWQFMRSTGRRYNLRIDGWVDERYDWHKATHAAIGYLKDLHAYFDGSWSLAVTAYNMGENGLERAIAANGGTRNFWELIETPPAANRIRRETKKYYPKFLATLIVTNKPERYGFKKNPQAAEDVVRVPMDGMYALEDLDQAMGYRRGTLAQLNPALLREVTPPEGGYAVAVPAKEKDRFLAALKKTPQLEYGEGTHRVRRGETVSQIAQLHSVSARELMVLNGIHNPRRLQVGRTLHLPGYGKGRGGSSSVTRSTHGTYDVKPGDTLYDIARAHGVSVENLQKWNGMDHPSRLQIGEKLHVFDPAQGPLTPVGDSYHLVRAGEYPAKIARSYGVPLEEFLAWNGLTKTSTIHVGQKLRISLNGESTKQASASNTKPAAGSAPPAFAGAAGTKRIVHKVAKNESASVIAAQHGVSTRDVLAWNTLSAKSVLRVGQELVLYVPSDSTGPTPPPPAQARLKVAGTSGAARSIRHIVAKGQNPTTIAQHYGVKVGNLFKWNNWPKKHVLHIGDEVLVYQN